MVRCVLSSLAIIFFLIPVYLDAQERTIQGTVIDDDGLPLIAANVLVVESGKGAVTDFNGRYTILASEGQTLQFSYVGYQTKEIRIMGQSTIDVVLSEGNQLDEIVVTALGITRRNRPLGYAIDEVGSRDLELSPDDNLLNNLQGKVTGVQITSN